MSRNIYPGSCYVCGCYVPVGFGHYQKSSDGWKIKCVRCASGRIVHDDDPEVIKAQVQLYLREKKNEVNYD